MNECTLCSDWFPFGYSILTLACTAHALLPSQLAGVCCYCLSGITISSTKIWELWMFEYLALTIFHFLKKKKKLVVLSFSVTFAFKVTYVIIPNPMSSSTLDPVSHLRNQIIFPYKLSIFIITQGKKLLYCFSYFLPSHFTPLSHKFDLFTSCPPSSCALFVTQSKAYLSFVDTA